MAGHSDDTGSQDSSDVPSWKRNVSSSAAHYLVLSDGGSSANITNFRFRVEMVVVIQKDNLTVYLSLLSHSRKNIVVEGGKGRNRVVI